MEKLKRHPDEQIDLIVYMVEQIFFHKCPLILVCRQWLLDSGIASAVGGKAGTFHRVTEKRYPK